MDISRTISACRSKTPGIEQQMGLSVTYERQEFRIIGTFSGTK